ncbi:hypothetical protein PYJP_14330 [Pyrofollis japonicus]|uniref:DUF434 domain-containing protein n=1 Tax=Pyrofollis japonicus TaxID=3060460 RepID=UPI00295A8058|nr:DUF434 domain-containing protein [Pyrofollis japonicus]BEP18081.1 hypothetical protein PYJP_14330 [Pyrofollis japonicus]
MKLSPKIFYDTYFLLARGYPRQPALELIRSKHGLSQPQVALLSRCIHPPTVNKEIASKKLGPSNIRDNCLVVDGFNQLTTIYAALKGEELYLCTDTMLRDALLAGPRHVIEHVDELAPILRDALSLLSPSEVIVVLDSQPSHSGETAARLRRYNINTIVSRNADNEVINLSIRKKCIAATSDIAITRKAPRIFDLARFTIEEILQKRLGKKSRINNIPLLLRNEHNTWCRHIVI